MKKLMFMLCAILAASVMQASTVSWSLSQVYQYGTDGSATSQRATDYVAYLMVGDGSGMTALAEGGADAIKTYVSANNTYGGSSLTSAGAITVSGYGNYAGTAAKQSYYAVVFDAATIDAAEHFYVTNVMEMQIPASGDGSVVFGKQKTGTTSTSNWYAVSGGGGSSDIPEPTSGLLLVLGGAMLALRRRRA